jgi:hypothetical protein
MTKRSSRAAGPIVTLTPGDTWPDPRPKVEPRQPRGNVVIENAVVKVESIYGGTAYELPDPFEDVTARRSRFEMWQSPTQRTLEQRPTLRRIHIERCHFTASDLGPIVLEDSLLDTIWIHRGKWAPQEIGGSVFKHVVIRGRITGSVRLWAYPTWLFLGLDPTGDAKAASRFIRANQRYYKSVDWALDISEAEFTAFENERADIPAHLYRRDPETQAIVTRESCRGRDWRGACGGSSLWVHIERFLETGNADTVVVAAKRSKYFAAHVEAIRRLRDIGVAIPG